VNFNEFILIIYNSLEIFENLIFAKTFKHGSLIC